MTARKSPTRKNPSPGKKRSARSGARKGSTQKKKYGAPLGGLFSREALFSRGATGAALLVAGLFFTAAFLTGRGGFLGEAGHAGATGALGLLGYALAPLAALVGALLLFDRLSAKRTSGAAILLAAGAATAAALLPDGRLFDADAYPERGGLLGSALYWAFDAAAGPVGAFFALVFLYSLGLFLLTGAAPRAAVRKLGEASAGLAGFLALLLRTLGRTTGGAIRGAIGGGRRSEKDRRRTGPPAEEANVVLPGKETGLRSPEPAGGAAENGARSSSPVGDPEEDPGLEEAFEVVLPEGRRGAEDPLGGGSLAGREQVDVGGEYAPPPFSLLSTGRGDPEHDAEGTSRRLTRALSELGVEAHVVRAVVGPRVTRYELRLGSGVKVGKVSNLQQDIAYALAATEVRILAPIPGKSAVGVEVPNKKAAKVTLGDVFREYPDANGLSLPVGLGKDISGRAVFFDLAEMPHLLVAGTTGSGKSVMLNGLLTSLLLTTDPRRVKMVLIDPKRVELSQFARVPHLITPVVTDVKKAANALTWAVAEMERRYEVLEKAGVRSLEGHSAARAERGQAPMPHVVVVIDELADLMMTAAAKVEDAIIRLAQKARAVGIHLVVATQRPSVDVITGMIKANVPSRIAFAVSSQVDSRVILDHAGAESLLGLGDMLFKPVTALRPSRVQGAYISEEEVMHIVAASAEAAREAYLKGAPAEERYIKEVTEGKPDDERPEEPEDDLLPEAARFVVASQQASVSAVQRRFRVGYSRAGRIIDALERKGVVGPYEGSKSRQVLAAEPDLERIFLVEGRDPGRDHPAEGPGEDPAQGFGDDLRLPGALDA